MTQSDISSPEKPGNGSRRTILVIEDDMTLNRLLCGQLSEMGHAVHGVASRADAMELLGGIAPDLALLDVRLPDSSGLSFLSELREYCPVIVLTAYASINQAVEAVKEGASEYLVKPVSPARLELAISRALETMALRRDLAFWQAEAQRAARHELIGDSAALAELRRMVGLLAASDSPVLIRGESGVGKGVIAAAIHAQGPRANGRFVTVDCDPEMMESELFGKVRNGQLIEGLLAAADHGTVFLNDIEKLSGTMQSRLLRLLEKGSYRPHGSNAEIYKDARVIVSTAADLDALVTQDRFRSQLYYKLSGFALVVPPLRDRREDILPLADSLLANRSFQRGVEKSFSADARDLLLHHDWPGNIRELANAVDRGVMLSAGEAVIEPDQLGLTHRKSATGDDATAVTLRFAAPPTLDDLRDAYIAELIERLDGNRQRIATVLGISERNLYRLLKPRA
ncbi:sigma-54 dependent transcriptional regulator [Paracoccus sp. SCSIO 75233]|uniref:sigma-54-dependent transcriptional regulator n=1 Tax=Paracoccus sp. SCSIO 75233 TaxID=3017782 RepID=UPI0022EFF29E|nr:sigma-54 dependent transcriptional regulator [Paracoccus sp. SCSIO 75233]WBU54211.1 sigma-54 dependent transcriptional regulator [Paracoccus sp. SCSIO 75233]